MKIFYSILVCITLYSIMSCSEDTIELEGLGAVKGKVVAVNTNEPLENVKISTNPSTSTVFSDKDGNYVIENIPTGDYSISAQREGLLAEFEAISVLTDKTLEVVFEMDVETAANRPPNAAKLVTPPDNATDQPVEVQLIWSGSDPDKEDVLEYTLSLRNDQNDTVAYFEEIKDTTYTVTGLIYGAKYFWQVTTTDAINDPVNSETFAFTIATASNNRIVFSRLVEGNSVIYSVDEAGENPIRLTSLSKNSFRPRRNVQNGKIAYLQSVGSQVHLFTMSLDGSNQKQITSQVPVVGFNLEEVDFSWDQNGAKLLYPNQDKLYEINNDGSGLAERFQTTNGNVITEIDVYEAGDITALKTNNLEGYNVEIFTIDASGTVLTTVVSGVAGAAGGINLSVGGNLLLFSRDVSAFESSSYRQLDTRLFVYNFADSTTTDISSDKPAGTNDLDARFSPNEVSVILTNTSNDGLSMKNIQTLAIQGGSARTSIIENASMPDWE
ncbi:carboxypeptidase-like regulatory domain-containing protein [Aquimarina intermedia]|uniref:Carboxypeptidase-like protein n=1 Tax=Aquimarina intermedia TaxID=350814 RepID=A0A5S5C4P7_9FLAO|nr:carboxypeptidase-like regulatory domain-containing protein [Aquimarina intermedia]TYP73578.1 carboxypeptidase-like protein [Aquimarina intermedia]